MAERESAPTPAPMPMPTSVEGEVPDGLLDAVHDYERALRENDLPALGRAFAPGAGTMRADAAGLLVGHEAIEAFRGARGGIAPRRLVGLHVRVLSGDRALVVSENEPAGGGAGVVTQVWARRADGWAIEAAHVGSSGPAFARSVWRLVGDPLVAGARGASLPLAGARVAVKDLFEIEGFPVGAGNPRHLEGSPPATATAPAVAALLDAGADLVGIARTDELAYSIAGRNVHYGTPPNVASPGHLPGGSSSGPAAAVALGQADIGLATDTAGSIRIPASYQGLWGLRTTHGAVDRAGLLPLAPSFDTIGWLTRDAATLRRVVTAVLPGDGPGLGGVVVAPELLALADDEVRLAFETLTGALEAELGTVGRVALGDPLALFAAFRVVQAAEAWQVHGRFVRANPGAFGPDVAARFEAAAAITPAEESEARQALSQARERLDEALGHAVLLLPSAPTTAPSLLAGPEEVDSVRGRTLATTSVAGITGRPAVSAPLMRIGRDYVGLCLVGPRGSDAALVARAARWAEAMDTV